MGLKGGKREEASNREREREREKKRKKGKRETLVRETSAREPTRTVNMY